MSEREDRKRLAASKRRANKARKFCVNTCPASRHVHLMADALARGQKYYMFDEEPQHCAETLLSVLTSLWEARDRLIELQGWWYPPEQAESDIRKATAAIREQRPTPETHNGR